jgi:hypothetical protein
MFRNSLFRAALRALVSVDFENRTDAVLKADSTRGFTRARINIL